MEATRAVHRMFFDYHPTVIHDLHEAIALLQTWNGTGPYNPHLDPIAYVIPEDQGDRRRVAEMVNRLLGQRIEIGQAAESIVAFLLPRMISHAESAGWVFQACRSFSRRAA
jgi:hypothetical protein